MEAPSTAPSTSLVEAVFTTSKLNPRKLKIQPRTPAGVIATAAADALWQQRQDIEAAADTATRKTLQRRYQKSLDAFVVTQQRLCSEQVRAFVGDDVDRDDLKQAAVVGLLVAVSKWLPGHGATFASWARWSIRDALRAELKVSHLVLGQRSHGRPKERLVVVGFDAVEVTEGEASLV